MTKQEKLVLMKDRYNKLAQNGKNIQSNGVIRKIKRQIRTLENGGIN